MIPWEHVQYTNAVIRALRPRIDAMIKDHTERGIPLPTPEAWGAAVDSVLDELVNG